MTIVLLLALQESRDGVRTVEQGYERVRAVLDELRTLVRRGTTQDEIDRRISKIDEIADEVRFQGRKVLHGTKPSLLSAKANYRGAGRPWKRLVDAVEKLESGNQTVTFTYSFIIAGTEMDRGKSVELKDHRDGRPTKEQFRQEIREALAVWEDLLEKAFSTEHGYGGNLEVRFQELGDETGTSFGSVHSEPSYPIPGKENLGDFRYGMENLGTTASPHSPMGRTKEGEGDAGGDVHFDSGQDWRRDRDRREGMTSVKIVAAHETGHGLALEHDETTSPMSLMNPRVIVQGSFGERFPQGLFYERSSELGAIVALYGSKAKPRKPEPILGIDLPTVSAAALGVNAIKVRTPEESKEASALLEKAVARLAEHAASLRR